MTTSEKYNNNPIRNLKLYWKQFYPDWEIPKGYHVHHTKPKCTFADPCDPKIHHPSNLIALHPDDHWLIHKLRGDKNVNWPFKNIIGEKKQPCSEATKRKISEEVMTRTKTECPYCLRSFDPGNYKQHHGDKCRMAVTE